MHKAILRLAKLRGETGVRLVTTNFDTLFEQARTEWQFDKDLHSGPILPIPRNDKAVTWRSVVYLHGRLDEVGANEHLVLTSADFGRSYLTDAWAARFVARLFSDFTVLFIGYSLNDPVLRYMTDAFAAENSSSRVASKRSPAYIFVPHKGKDDADDTPYRNQLGETVGPLAQALTAAGLHIGLDDLPRQATQGAIRRLGPETRAGMLHWIVGALTRGDDRTVDPDAVWAEKAKPWIQKFWPRDPQIRSTTEARPWVEMALATNEAFEDAVATVSQFIRPGENDFVLGELANSGHLNAHPRSALRLMDAFLSPNAQFWAFDDLRRALDSVLASDLSLRDDPAFARWDGFERARA